MGIYLAISVRAVVQRVHMDAESIAPFEGLGIVEAQANRNE